MNQKGFVNIILVVVIIILIGAVGYFAFIRKSTPIAQQTPTQTETKSPTPTSTPTQPLAPKNSWTTYVNTILGYSVDYPSDWMFTEDNGSGCKFCLLAPTNYVDQETQSAGRGELFVFKVPISTPEYLKDADAFHRGANSLQSYLDIYSKREICSPKGPIAGDAYCVDYKKITFQGKAAFLVLVRGMGSGYDVVFEHSGKVYIIALPDVAYNINFDLSKLPYPESKILSSYKLLNQNTKPTPTPVPQKSGIKGTVVRRYCGGAPPPEGVQQSCVEEFFASFALKIKNDTSGIEKQVTTDNSGKFQIELQPGTYIITKAVENFLIHGDPFGVEVKSGIFTDIQLKFIEPGQ